MESQNFVIVPEGYQFISNQWETCGEFLTINEETGYLESNDESNRAYTCAQSKICIDKPGKYMFRLQLAHNGMPNLNIGVANKLDDMGTSYNSAKLLHMLTSFGNKYHGGKSSGLYCK